MQLLIRIRETAQDVGSNPTILTKMSCSYSTTDEVKVSFEKAYQERRQKLGEILSDIQWLIEDFKDLSPEDWNEIAKKILVDWGEEQGGQLVRAMFVVRKHLDHLNVLEK